MTRTARRRSGRGCTEFTRALMEAGRNRRDHQPPRRQVVIVGAGIAGLRAAERLRERGFDGSIVFIGDEPHKPYNRTPLSKQLLAQTGRLSDLRLPVYWELDATWRPGTRALGLDVARQRLLLPRGEELAYDGLVIATGVEARHLPGAPLWVGARVVAAGSHRRAWTVAPPRPRGAPRRRRRNRVHRLRGGVQPA
nr:FAD-dependent oxidoreductase [Candidatus Frankia nodulisporulans]